MKILLPLRGDTLLPGCRTDSGRHHSVDTTTAPSETSTESAAVSPSFCVLPDPGGPSGPLPADKYVRYATSPSLRQSSQREHWLAPRVRLGGACSGAA